jgi:hypothetical protein
MHAFTKQSEDIVEQMDEGSHHQVPRSYDSHWPTENQLELVYEF